MNVTTQDMSRRRGWDEAQVRGQPVMGGFTAINAPAARPEAAQSTSEKHFAYHDTYQQSVAAADLGRGDEQSSVVTARGKKAAGSRGKKRASTGTSAAKAKRRKSSAVSDGLTVSKAKAREKADSSASKLQTSSEATPSGRHKAVAQVTGEAAEDVPGIKQPLAVFSQPTSMGSFQSVQQAGAMTSVEAIRATNDYGQTVYDGRQPSSTVDDAVQVAQPWLNIATANNSSPQRARKKRRKSSRTKSFQAEPIDESIGMPESPAATTRKQKQTPNEAQKPSLDDQQLPTPVPSDAPVSAPSARQHPRRQAKKAPPIQTDEECFLGSDESDSADIADAVDEAEEVSRKDLAPPSRRLKDNVRTVDPDDDYGGELFSAAERLALDDLEKNSSQDVGRKPIVRKPFPDAMLDRSPIFGASNITTLRTCFRVGEVLNVGCRAVRMNRNVLLELYARVTQSRREEKPRRVQHFVFKDLYHDKPPHIVGTFDLWDQSKLWELDSRVFLSADKSREGVMCRAIARMKRDGLKWRLEVLSIWEASWDDVEAVAGIYSRSGE